jgi:hypothetical protein
MQSLFFLLKQPHKNVQHPKGWQCYSCSLFDPNKNGQSLLSNKHITELSNEVIWHGWKKKKKFPDNWKATVH